MKPVIVAVLFLAASTSVAQQLSSSGRHNNLHAKPVSAEELTATATDVLERVAQSMGRYARDISELPLNVESTISEFDFNGHEKSKKSSAHSMQFVERSYGDGKVARRLQVHRPGLRGVSADEINGNSATGLLALLFDNGTVSASRKHDLILHVVSRRLEVKMTDESQCDGFDPRAVEVNRRFCGDTRLLVDSETLDPITASFEARGFPKTFGKVRYLSFGFREEFQKVKVKENEEPFLLPARVVVTYESDRGRTVIESTYSVRG